MITILIRGIRLYQQIISAGRMPCCRFVPSCSDYMIEALEKKGLIKGFLKGVHRLLRCHPWGQHGYDPVP